MNKAELLVELEGKFEDVLAVVKQSEVAGVSYYVANVFDVVGDTGRTINVMFFVKDESLAGEVAFWGSSEPKPTPPPVVPTFADEAQAWLQSKIDVAVGSNNIRMFDQFTADNVQERARVRLTLENTGTGVLSTVDVALWKVAGVFQYKVITP